MADHQTSSRPSSYTGPYRQHPQLHPSSSSSSHHQSYRQDYHGPLSASVVEGGRAFPIFHSTLHHPPQPLPAPASSASKAVTLSVSDILERYHDANKDFLVSVLNAKAKEDERIAEEERYRTEQVKLQAKKIDLELVQEKRRALVRPYPSSNTADSLSSTYPSTNGPYYSNYSQYPPSATETPRQHQSHGQHSHHDHQQQDTHDQRTLPPPHGEQHSMQPSPQGRPPFLKINTSVRQTYPSHSSIHTAPPAMSSKGSSRHYTTSSPVTMMDYQSHIPPPLTPKDDHSSPTSALSPTQSYNLKRKSINHDAIMDAVRAKVMRNAGQNQKKAAPDTQHDRDQNSGASASQPNRRKPQQVHTMPEPSKPYTEPSNSGKAESKAGERCSSVEVKLEGPLISPSPLTVSPKSNSDPSPTQSSRSGSSSPRPVTSVASGQENNEANSTAFESNQQRTERQAERGVLVQ